MSASVLQAQRVMGAVKEGGERDGDGDGDGVGDGNGEEHEQAAMGVTA